MQYAMLEIMLHCVVIAALAVLAGRGRVHAGWLAVALLLMLLRDALVLRGYGWIPNPWPGSQWNWMGKGLAFAGLAAVAFLPGFGKRESGLCLRQRPGAALAWWVFAGVVLACFALALARADGADALDTIAFQWSMPGLEEELFYRGVLLHALYRSLGEDGQSPALGIGRGGVLACVAFGLGHALSWRAGGISFDATAFLLTGGPALLLTWFRTRTGSLVLPVLAHNVANGAWTLF